MIVGSSSQVHASGELKKEFKASISENLTQISEKSIEDITGMTEEELKAYIQDKLTEGTYQSEEEIRQAVEDGKELIEQSKEEYEQMGEEIASEAKEAVSNIVKNKVNTFFENIIKQIKDFFANLF